METVSAFQASKQEYYQLKSKNLPVLNLTSTLRTSVNDSPAVRCNVRWGGSGIRVYGGSTRYDLNTHGGCRTFLREFRTCCWRGR